jgi:hypothetical protein
MIINRAVLEIFGACEPAAKLFREEFPNGLDISDLWGEYLTRKRFWEKYIQVNPIKENLGWAIEAGIIPAVLYGNFSEMDLSDISIKNADLSLVESFHDARMIRGYFHNCNMTNTNLHGVDFSQAQFFRTRMGRFGNMRRVNFTDAVLCDVEISNCDLRGSNFCGATLENVKFLSVNVQGVSLEDAKLINVHWS